MILMKKSGWDILTTESPTEHRSFEYLRCFMNGLKRYGLKGPRKLPCQCKHDQGAVPKMATWLMDVDGFGIFKTTKLYKYSVGYGRINKDQLGLAGNCIYIYNLFIYFIYLFNSFYWFIYLVLFIHDASSIINLVSSISIDCKEIKGSETKKTPSSHPLPPASVAASGAQLLCSAANLAKISFTSVTRSCGPLLCVQKGRCSSRMWSAVRSRWPGRCIQ